MISVVTFLWDDPNGAYAKLYRYGPDHVNRMWSMLRRHLRLPHALICVTDIPEGLDARIHALPLDRSTIGGPHARYPKLQVFAPDAAERFGSRIWLLDLDTVLTADVTHIVDRPEPLVLWENSSWGKPGRTRYNSSTVLLDAGAAPEVWAAFSSGEGYARHDQEWISRVIGPDHPHTWNANGSDGLWKARDMKRNTLPKECRLVTFAGKQDPSHGPTRRRFPWIREHWC